MTLRYDLCQAVRSIWWCYQRSRHWKCFACVFWVYSVFNSIRWPIKRRNDRICFTPTNVVAVTSNQWITSFKQRIKWIKVIHAWILITICVHVQLKSSFVSNWSEICNWIFPDSHSINVWYCQAIVCSHKQFQMECKQWNYRPFWCMPTQCFAVLWASLSSQKSLCVFIPDARHIQSK